LKNLKEINSNMKFDKIVIKTQLKLKDIPNSFLALDEIKIGHGGKIPLWLFGFLY